MLDTASVAATDLIAEGYAEPSDSLAHRLALLCNELLVERALANDERDVAIIARCAAELRLLRAEATPHYVGAW